MDVSYVPPEQSKDQWVEIRDGEILLLDREKSLKQGASEIWEAVHSCIPGHGQAETRGDRTCKNSQEVQQKLYWVTHCTPNHKHCWHRIYQCHKDPITLGCQPSSPISFSDRTNARPNWPCSCAALEPGAGGGVGILFSLEKSYLALGGS